MVNTRRLYARVPLVSFLTLVILFAFTAGVALAHGDERPDKEGILLVAFGTSVPEAKVAFKNIDAKVKAAFPGVEVRWAYTSKIIRDKLAGQGEYLDSPEVALSKMMSDDFTHVAVQSLHTIPGEEYHDLVQVVHAFADLPGGPKKVLIGLPMLAVHEDLLRTADALLANIPAERKKDEAVIYMGHGTPHPGNVYYPAMQYYLAQKDPNVFVGTVEGAPNLDDITAQLKAKGLTTAYLIPFMSVAGDHAQNDLAGPEDDSWKSILTKAGVKCIPVLKGTAEYDNMVEIWVSHLKSAMDHFK